MWFVRRGRGVLPKFVCVCVFSFKSRPLRRKVTFGILNVGEGDHQSKKKSPNKTVSFPNGPLPIQGKYVV